MWCVYFEWYVYESRVAHIDKMNEYNLPSQALYWSHIQMQGKSHTWIHPKETTTNPCKVLCVRVHGWKNYINTFAWVLVLFYEFVFCCPFCLVCALRNLSLFRFPKIFYMFRVSNWLFLFEFWLIAASNDGTIAASVHDENRCADVNVCFMRSQYVYVHYKKWCFLFKLTVM